MYKFKPYGPFEVPIEDGCVVASEMKDFWKAIEKMHPGLQDAVGCYIFGSRARNSSRPWYVGKTERMSFKREAFLQYQEALKGRTRGTSLLYLIPRVTAAGKFRKPGKGKNGCNFHRQTRGIADRGVFAEKPQACE